MRNLLGNFAGALEDLDVVLQHGRNDAEVYQLRGTAFYQQGKWADADREMSAAIERGATSGGMLFSRGIVRFNLNDLAGAEKDLSAALERGVDLDETAGQLRKIQSGARPELALFPSRNPRSRDPIISSLLGIVRLRLGRSKEAEEDLTAAIDAGASESIGSFMDAIKESTLPMFDALKDRLKSVHMPSAGTLFHLRGASRLNLGKLSEAETDFERALSLGWADGEVYLGRGWARLGMGKFADAEQDAETALERGKKDAFTYALCGLAHLNLKAFAKAEQYFVKATELDAENAQLFAWLGAARLNLNKLQEAETDLTASLDRRPDDAQTLFLRGCVRSDLQKNFEAEKDLTAALDLGFNQAAVFSLRGLARLRQNKIADADEDAAAAFAGMAGDMPAHLLIQAYSLRAGVRSEQQRHAEAEQDATAALSLGLDQAQAVGLFTIRGSARLAQNKVSEADEDVIAAFAGIAADTPAPVLILAYSLRAALRFEQERYAEADLDFTEAMRLGRKDAFVLFNRGRARQALERYTEAEQDYDATIALGKDAAISMGVVPAEVFMNRGRTQAALQRWREAEQDFIGAIEAGRDDAFVHVYVGLALQEQKRYSEAETEFDLAIARDSQPLVRFQRGSLRLIRGNFLGAESDFDEIITLETTNASALYARGLSLYGQQKDAEALADYNAALVLSPKEARFLASRITVLLRLGNLDEAAKGCAQLGEMDAGAADTEGCFGLLQLAQGDLDSALSHLATAGLRDRSWCYWQGLVLLLIGRLEEAQEAYTKAGSETAPGDILIALDELEIHLRQYPTRVVSSEAKSTIGHIQIQLRRQLDTMNERVGLQELNSE